MAIERIRNVLGKVLDKSIILRLGQVEKKSNYREEFMYNKDRTRRFRVIDCSLHYGAFKSLELQLQIAPDVWKTNMEAKEIILPGDERPNYQIIVNAIEPRAEVIPTVQASYDSYSNGVKAIPSTWTGIMGLTGLQERNLMV